MKSSFNILFFILIIILILPFVGCKKEDSSAGPGDDNTPIGGIKIVINSTPPGSKIDIDNVPTNQVTPYTIDWDNSKESPHRFRIYNDADRKVVDTSFYIFKNTKYTINADNYLMWKGEWGGSRFVGAYLSSYMVHDTHWEPFNDTIIVPLTANAKITLRYNDNRCYNSRHVPQIKIGDIIIDLGPSPVTLTTSNGLIRGSKGKLGIRYLYGYYFSCDPSIGLNCCSNGITVTYVKLETY